MKDAGEKLFEAGVLEPNAPLRRQLAQQRTQHVEGGGEPGVDLNLCVRAEGDEDVFDSLVVLGDQDITMIFEAGSELLSMYQTFKMVDYG